MSFCYIFSAGFPKQLQHKLYCEQSAITSLQSCHLLSNKFTSFCMTWRASVCTLVNWLSWIPKHSEHYSLTQEWVPDIVNIKTRRNLASLLIVFVMNSYFFHSCRIRQQRRKFRGENRTVLCENETALDLVIG